MFQQENMQEFFFMSDIIPTLISHLSPPPLSLSEPIIYFRIINNNVSRSIPIRSEIYKYNHVLDWFNKILNICL